MASSANIPSRRQKCSRSLHLPLEMQGNRRNLAVSMSDSPLNPRAPGRSEEPASAEEKTLDKLLAEAQSRIDEQKDAWMRAMAEAENTRKRAQADVQAAQKYAIELTSRQLKAALEKASVREFSPSPGDRFDPHVHQAMAAVDAPGAEPNTIVAVMLKGYRLHDRILRPALVTVAKALESGEGNPISNSNLNTN